MADVDATGSRVQRERYDHKNGSDTEHVRTLHASLGGMHRADDFDAHAPQVWYEHESIRSESYGWHTLTGSIGAAFRGFSVSFTWGRS